MKKLTLIRHANSNWKHPGLSDHDRPLNKKGEMDASEMGRRFSEHGARLDKIYASTAMRARTTALKFLDAMKLDDSHMELEDELYLASKEMMLGFISDLEHDDAEIAIVGHNPGMSDLAKHLSQMDVGDMPTCCVIELSYDVNSWPEVPAASPATVWQDYPQG